MIALKILYPIDKLVDKPSLWELKHRYYCYGYYCYGYYYHCYVSFITYISFVLFFLITTSLSIMMFIRYFHFLKVIYKLTGVINPIGLGAGQSFFIGSKTFQRITLMKFHSLFPLQ